MTFSSVCLVIVMAAAPAGAAATSRLLDEFEARLAQDPGSLRVDTTLRELYPDLPRASWKAVP